MTSYLMRRLVGFVARLRFPYLFAVTVVLFLVDLAVPDVIPFVDEIMLALVALILGAIKKRTRQQ